MKKASALLSALVLSTAISGCIAAHEQVDGDSIDAIDAQSEALTKIATLDVPGGKVIFVDEGATDPGAGIAFWEIGRVDLSYLLEVQNASALEVFLALAPEGATPPARLVQHHEEIAARTGAVPKAPRRLATTFALPQVNAFTNDGLGHDGTDSSRDCWDWAGVSGAYGTQFGKQDFDEETFHDNFNADAYVDDIPGGTIATSTGFGLLRSMGSSPPIQTSSGHQRAMAICASKAGGQTANSLITDCTGNRIVAQITISRTDTSGNFVTADIITLDAFGEGARFRSNFLNGAAGARKYAASATFFAHADEAVTGADITCRDEVAVAWRSRWAPPLAGATGERGASE